MCPYLLSFGQDADTPAPPPSRSTRRGLSGIVRRPVQRVQRPGVCAVVSTGGVYSHRPAPSGQSRHHRKNKKGSKITPPPLPIFKISRKKQKDPYKGSVFCAILALQALKGRNLQNGQRQQNGVGRARIMRTAC